MHRAAASRAKGAQNAGQGLHRSFAPALCCPAFGKGSCPIPRQAALCPNRMEGKLHLPTGWKRSKPYKKGKPYSPCGIPPWQSQIATPIYRLQSYWFLLVPLHLGGVAYGKHRLEGSIFGRSCVVIVGRHTTSGYALLSFSRTLPLMCPFQGHSVKFGRICSGARRIATGSCGPLSGSIRAQRRSE